jgi:hypothetical protein
MSQEIETAALDSAGGFFRLGRRKAHAFEPGSLCANCSTPLLGPWCHACGQLGEDFHRSTLKLLGEAFEGLVHFDGRMWATLPDLAFKPAALTRGYLEGRRAPQIPPLRLFLVVLLVFFLAGSLPGGGGTAQTVVTDDHGHVLSKTTKALTALTPEQKDEVKAQINKAAIKFDGFDSAAATEWLKARLIMVLDDPERFKLILESWSERFAFLTLPLAAGLLSLLYVFQRRFFVYDHIIFSLHSLSAMGLLATLVRTISAVVPHGASVLFLAAPVHLFFHMRGVYGSSVPGTLARMAVLFVLSLIGILLIGLGLLFVGLNGMGA